MKLNFQALSFSIDVQDLALALKDIDDAVEMLKFVLISFYDINNIWILISFGIR